MSGTVRSILDFRGPAVVFKINRMYKPGMTKDEIYEAARGIWKIDWETRSPKFAIVSAFGKVQGVFHILGWEPADFVRLGTAPVGRLMWHGEWADEFNNLRLQEINCLPGGHTTGPFFYINC